MAMESDIGGERDALAPAHGLHPVVHEIAHDEEVDDLADHEPDAHVLGEDRRRALGVELVEFAVGEDPEDYGQDPRDGLRGHEVGSECFDFSALHIQCCTFLLNRMN